MQPIRNTSLERQLSLAAMWQQVQQMPPGVLQMQFMQVYECLLNQSDALAVAEAQLRSSSHQIHAMSKSLLLLEGVAAGTQSTPSAPSPPPEQVESPR